MITLLEGINRGGWFWPWKKSVAGMAALHLVHDLVDWVKAVVKVACWILDPKDNGEELESLKGINNKLKFHQPLHALYKLLEL